MGLRIHFVVDPHGWCCMGMIVFVWLYNIILIPKIVLFPHYEEGHIPGILIIKDPKASGGSQETYAYEMKDLCHHLRDPHWTWEVLLKVKMRAPLTRTAAIPSDSEALSSSSDENSQVRIRKTITAGISKKIIRPRSSQTTLTHVSWVLPVDQREFWELCNKCNLMRPKRSHHCSRCGHCVRRMDHHCPWINNCVGEDNHWLFLQLCFYTELLTCYALMFSFCHYYYFLPLKKHNLDYFVFRHELAIMRLAAFMGITMFVGITGLFYTQLIGIITNGWSPRFVCDLLTVEDSAGVLSSIELHLMKAADNIMAGKTSDSSIKWQLCYDMSARTWWMVVFLVQLWGQALEESQPFTPQ
ncbi:Putative palmitoyltransferase ZDHHC21 [Fukomys damarensis]|uniref:Palmitoyltransferase n=1 Tax=Fukomys damarensis TaxID=885580 RepID=A0A091DJJ5_FUKDA|nr:Putative palmitoyltransferase ZDHHC21 [Fukomys damarensis]